MLCYIRASGRSLSVMNMLSSRWGAMHCWRLLTWAAEGSEAQAKSGLYYLGRAGGVSIPGERGVRKYIFIYTFPSTRGLGLAWPWRPSLHSSVGRRVLIAFLFSK